MVFTENLFLNTLCIVLAGNSPITRKGYEEDEVYAIFLGLKFTSTVDCSG
jgi:hypothetical protein